MPSGKTHDTITLLLCGPIAILAFYLMSSWVHIAIAFFAFLFAGIAFNGDLDLNSKPYKRWGWFKFIWSPYQKLFNHRSIFTHGPVIGTIIRLLWILVPMTPILIFVSPAVIWAYVVMYQVEILVALCAIEAGSLSHTLADVIL